MAQTDEWIALQTQIAAAAVHNTTIDISKVRRIGGLDVTFDPDTKRCIAALSIVSFPDMKEEHTEMLEMDDAHVPEYVSGFLAFREVHVYEQLFAQCAEKNIELPDLFLVDGNGQYHAREAGVATHLGVQLGIATIGVGKKTYVAENIHEPDVRQEIPQVHGTAPVHTTSGTHIATMFRSGQSKYPLFVSSGHMVSLEDSVEIVKKCCMHRIPEPIRLADKGSRARLADIKKESSA
ncbi:Endonuclease V [Carpediemonas membranifera]|uniref:Endonuclease V n=1 Tax=Carpediemonas membranifera TaxID=201153 RepID=A0A8J6AXA3_9EUKA|nr:Endonuclease V [Carpediemonas membranifera]|eukprot:KAG9390648.1 Endonuclease V [Carpediemonas membranifera]